MIVQTQLLPSRLELLFQNLVLFQQIFYHPAKRDCLRFTFRAEAIAGGSSKKV